MPKGPAAGHILSVKSEPGFLNSAFFKKSELFIIRNTFAGFKPYRDRLTRLDLPENGMSK
jgi:hypothetical protein